VLTFFDQWRISNDAILEAIRNYFTAETVFENVGVVTTVGIDEALDLMQVVGRTSGYATCDIETLHVAEAGAVVLTERFDVNRNANGDAISSHRLMGALEVRDGKIVAWRDYFDTAALNPVTMEAG
jgi:limonene-1,2-epoxide hydrolase